MATGRNAPCPCGSGKKYKQCCLRLERGAAQQSGQGAAIRQTAQTAVSWQADIVPVPIGLDNDPSSRPGVVLIVGGGLVLHAYLLSRPSAEPEAMAAEIERQLAVAGEKLGGQPVRVEVGYPELAAELARRLAPDISVEVGELEELREAASALRADMSGQERESSFVCSPTTWAGWGLAEQWSRSMHQAAAAFFRTAPWQHLWDSQVLELTAPSGDRWLACVMGKGDREFGLALYGDDEDLESMLEGDAQKDIDATTGPVISLLFWSGSELPREARKETSRAGWEIAGPDAYPSLLTLNTPGGGITRQNGEDFLACLRAVPEFVEDHQQQLAGYEHIDGWHHQSSGVGIQIWQQGPASLAPPPFSRLRPGSAQGAGACPEAAVDRGGVEEDPDALLEREMAVVWRFQRSLENEGLSDKTVGKHTQNAETFISFLAYYAGLPLAAVHEYDLRAFLFDWYPRKVIDSRTTALGLPGSLRRFFRYLADAEEIRLPTAEEVFKEKDYYVARWDSFPGGHWWDPEVGEWCALGRLPLDARLMIPNDELGDDEWGATMGPTEARLRSELERRWLLWRDELLALEMSDARELRKRLSKRQRTWETTPHADHDGKTPFEAIEEEREETDRRRR